MTRQGKMTEEEIIRIMTADGIDGKDAKPLSAAALAFPNTTTEGSTEERAADDAEAIGTIIGDNPGKRKLTKRRQKRLTRKLKRWNKAFRYTADNDIRYRGTLSYRSLRILAWFSLLISQLGMIMSIAVKYDGGFAQKVGKLPEIFKMADSAIMPFFLLATFAVILNGTRSFKSMMIVYGGASALFYGLFLLLHERYIATIAAFIMGTDRLTAVSLIDTLLETFVTNGYLAFNVFVDLFFCTLFAFFLLHKPKRLYGKKLACFRLLGVVPVLYEVGCLTLKLLGVLDKIVVSPYLYPLLTTKPPMAFLVFVMLVFYIKRKERRFYKTGRTHEEFTAFLKTKANSWQFSKYAAILFLIAGFIDLILYLGMTFGAIGISNLADTTEIDQSTAIAIFTTTKAVMKVGIGKSSALMLASPFVLLFSYTRSYKDNRGDMVIPVIAIIALIILYLEGITLAANKLGTIGQLISKIKRR